jgi:hypothetical protein
MHDDKIKIALLEQSMVNNEKDHAEIKTDMAGVKSDIKGMIDKLDKAIACKVDKEDFLFWRNILITGIIMTIFASIIMNIITGR